LKLKRFRAAEDGFLWPLAGLGKGIKDWLDKVMLG